MKKVIAGLMAVLLACGMLGMLVGCGNNDERIIREGIAKEFDELKDPSSNTITSQLSSLTQFGVDTEAFAAAWLEGYDYKIGTITVNGDTATAEVTLTIKQVGPILDEAMNSVTTSGETNISQADATKLVAEAFVKAAQTVTPSTVELVVPCTLNDKMWSVDSSFVNSKLQEALIGESEYM